MELSGVVHSMLLLNKINSDVTTIEKIRLLMEGIGSAEGCWIWNKGKFSDGRGAVYIGGNSKAANKVAYEILIDDIPNGSILANICGHNSCINPDHFEVITRSDAYYNHQGNRTPEEYIQNRVDIDHNTGCWNWNGSMFLHGYGSAKYRGAQEAAHRLSYKTFIDAIPDGMFVCHSCDNKACVNPEHLWIGTAADNSRDMVEKGRSVVPRSVFKTGVRAVGAMYSDEHVRSLKIFNRDNPEVTARELGDIFGMKRATVSKITSGVNYADIVI